MRIRSLRTRIALTFSALLLVVQLLGFFAARETITHAARLNTETELQQAEKVFNQIMQSHRDQLSQAAAVVAADFGFREAVATRNQGTIVSALRNTGDRIKADLVMLLDLDARTVADTRISDEEGALFPYPDLIAQARSNGSASNIIQLDGRLYELVVVPVKAPVTIGWVAMGFEIDSRFIGLLNSTMALDVSFLGQAVGGGWAVLASSLPGGTAANLIAPANAGQLGREKSIRLTLNQEEYGARTVLLHSGPNGVEAVLQRSIAEAAAPFLRIQAALLVLSLIGLVVSIVVSLLIARGVTRPVAMLTGFARSVGEGGNPPPLELAREDEIGALAHTFNDMREALDEREARITGLAYQDSLTGLPNRALFRERVMEAIALAQRGEAMVAVMVMDLDRFKYVNDTLGHTIGDQLLVEVGQRLHAAMGPQSATVARLGGDEFAVLLIDGSEAEAMRVAQSLLTLLERPMLLEGQVVDVGASIGIVCCPMHGDDVDTLMRRADIAMYAAKRSGSGCLLYDSRHDTQTPERLSLMGELRHAVEHDHLTVFYQPKMDLATGEVRQVEALVRWDHATRGFIAPDRFIPFAEQTGYIKAITRWVVRHVVAQTADWLERGIDLQTSINVSARDLLDNELPDFFQNVLKEYRVDPRQIWIEITESAVMEDPAHALSTLEKLHNLGFRLSIDDFGTGYSSLAYLKRMPVDEIKIDRSFVMGMVTERDDEVIVRSTIDLGHNMGLKVVAEGVETQEILDRLRECRCDLAQGWLLSRPMPAAKLEDWLLAWRAKKATA
ncbi:EAL domain-containing protein [Xylophilus rhododendri]|uniref:EAL domain-containing protein n=1 Tax=Xylophilus rhododendri TaxID=2697032 RepID=A0A857JC41_9BURK|nr:EAL domain-containing protein [Xylophilus rhododendri]